MSGCGEDLHGGIGVHRITALSVLRVQQQLRSEVAGRWRVCGALGVSDETALFTEHSALLDALEAYSANDSYNRS